MAVDRVICADGRVVDNSSSMAMRSLKMILIIDNYDSFTYNLVQRLGEIDSSLDIQVYRNNRITTDEVESLRQAT